MKHQLVTICLSTLLLIDYASALNCYVCQSDSSWSDCSKNQISTRCPEASRGITLYGKEILIQPRSIDEPACVSVEASADLGGTKVRAFVRDCLFNEKALCDVIQSNLPEPIRITTCDLCTTDLCNSAGSVVMTMVGILPVLLALGYQFAWH